MPVGRCGPSSSEEAPLHDTLTLERRVTQIHAGIDDADLCAACASRKLVLPMNRGSAVATVVAAPLCSAENGRFGWLPVFVFAYHVAGIKEAPQREPGGVKLRKMTTSQVGTRIGLAPQRLMQIEFAVETVVTGRPPHRSARAEFPHAAPTSDA